MPQLDLDLIEDFLFVAFAGLLLGVGNEETEERVIATAAEAHLANLYVGGRKALRAETRLVASAARVLCCWMMSALLLVQFSGSINGWWVSPSSGFLAQLVERGILNPVVTGSIPVEPTSPTYACSSTG